MYTGASIYYLELCICIRNFEILSNHSQKGYRMNMQSKSQTLQTKGVPPNVKPVAVLKRFADQLETSNDLAVQRYREVNFKRTDDFINKPMRETVPIKDNRVHYEEKKIDIPGIFDYNAVILKPTVDFHLNEPEFQSALGPHARFGEGDGSFWDRWINSDPANPSLLPTVGAEIEPTSGFKRYYNKERSSGKLTDNSGSMSLKVKPYAERRKERLAREAQEVLKSSSNGNSAVVSLTNEISNTKDDLEDALSVASELIFRSPSKIKMNIVNPSLPPLTSSQEDFYFGDKGRVGFFEFYKHLSRHRNELADNRSPDHIMQLLHGMGSNTVSESPPQTSVPGLSTNMLEYSERSAKSPISSRNTPGHLLSVTSGRSSPSANPNSGRTKSPITGNIISPTTPSRRISANLKITGAPRSSLIDSVSASQPVTVKGLASRIRPDHAKKYIQDSDFKSVLQSKWKRLEKYAGEDHLEHPDSSGVVVGEYRNISPRTQFMVACVKDEVLPRPSLLIRKDIDATLDLSRQYMGNNIATSLAKALVGLPYLLNLNLSDNNLTSPGVLSVISTIVRCEYLSCLNLSNNKTDLKATHALASYLSATSVTVCPLSHLIMRQMSLDDSEVRCITEAILQNPQSKIEYIDFGQNVIGSEETRRSIHTDYVTGGTSFGILLSTNNNIKVLKLDWNMIRMQGAIALCQSIKINQSITDLDLSYNGIGEQGGEVLGDALHSNSSLKILNLSQNNITPKACFVLATGIACCPTLECVNLSSNPIGEPGAKALVQLCGKEGDRVNVIIKDCGIRYKDKSCWFDKEKVVGDFSLDLTVPYERAVSIELLSIIADSDDLKVKSCKYSWGGSNQELNLVVKSEIKKISGDNASTVSRAETIRSIASDIHFARKIFGQFDEDHSGSLDAEELAELLKYLGLKNTRQTVSQLLSMYDTDGAGVIEEDEFVGFLEEVQKSAEQKRNEGEEIYYMILSGASSKYTPPDVGRLDIQVQKDKGVPDLLRSMSTLTGDSIERVINVSKGSEGVLIDYALADSKLTCEEALPFYKALIKETGDKMRALIRLLPRMYSPGDARLLISAAIQNDIHEKLVLKKALEPLYRPIIGLPNGFYNLDLSSEIDFLCFKRLLNLSETTSNNRNKKLLGDISQYSNWSCFRNVVIDGKHSRGGLDTLSVLDAPVKIQFDFVSMQEVDMQSVQISDIRFVNVASALGIIAANRKSIVIDQINQLHATGRQACHGTGVRDWEMTQRAAELAACHLNLCYEGIFHRIDSQYSMEAYVGSIATAESLLKINLDDLDSEYDSSVDDEDEGLAIDPLNVGKDVAAVTQNTLNEVKSLKNERYEKMKRFNIQNYIRLNVPKETMHNLEKNYSLDHFREFLKQKGRGVVKDDVSRLVRTVEALQDTLGGRIVSCAQLASLMEPLAGGGLVLDIWSTVRVDLIVSFSTQIIDPINFELILQMLLPMEIGMLQCRLGWLYLWVPVKPEGYVYLDLTRNEERQILRMLIVLTVIEPGLTWIDKGFFPAWGSPYISNWALTSLWYTENGIPDNGILRIRFHSGEGSGFNDCMPDVITRAALMAIVFAQPYSADIRFTHKPTVERAENVCLEAGLKLSFTSTHQREIHSSYSRKRSVGIESSKSSVGFAQGRLK